MKIAVLPSNQHLNPYAGLPGVTEERFAVAVCKPLVTRLRERGANAEMFHVAGAGAASTDELSTMLKQAVAWKPDYMFSVHSDAVGDAKQTGILMLMAREADRSEGVFLGHAIAKAVGLPYKGTWVYGQEARKIMYLRTLRETGLRGCLVEVGEHATKAEALWNWTHIDKIAYGLADALADYLGLEGEMAIDHTSESAFDKADKVLKELGILDPDGRHPWQEAAGVSLLWTVVQKAVEPLYARIDALEKTLPK